LASSAGPTCRTHSARGADEAQRTVNASPGSTPHVRPRHAVPPSTRHRSGARPASVARRAALDRLAFVGRNDDKQARFAAMPTSDRVSRKRRHAALSCSRRMPTDCLPCRRSRVRVPSSAPRKAPATGAFLVCGHMDRTGDLLSTWQKAQPAAAAHARCAKSLLSAMWRRVVAPERATSDGTSVAVVRLSFVKLTRPTRARNAREVKAVPLSGDETAGRGAVRCAGQDRWSRDRGCSWEALVGQAAGNRWAVSPALFVAAPATCPGVLRARIRRCRFARPLPSTRVEGG
jgi:hypothetical protein